MPSPEIPIPTYEELDVIRRESYEVLVQNYLTAVAAMLRANCVYRDQFVRVPAHPIEFVTTTARERLSRTCDVDIVHLNGQIRELGIRVKCPNIATKKTPYRD